MRLERVTITGIDDGVDLAWIDEMTAEYPLVEWGVLFSDKKKGVDRYPSSRWLADLTRTYLDKYDEHFALHLCGSACDRFIKDSGHTYRTGELIESSEPRFFPRIQLNSFADSAEFDFTNINMLALQMVGYAEIIVPITCEKTHDRLKQNMHDNINFMHDPSRGQGIETSDWPEPHTDHFTGFAGGIGPHNVRAVLDKLCAREADRWFWIDMESNVRTDDKLDPKKVEEVLKIAKEYA